MSEQNNTAVVQSVYDAFNKGDLDTVLANIDPKAEWIDHGPESVPYFGNFSGRIPEFFDVVAGSVMDGRVAIDQYVASGNIVVTRGRWIATVRSTGAKINADIAHFFTVRDGKITSWIGYGDTAAVLAAHTGKAAAA
jgi:uncharacterized protein